MHISATFRAQLLFRFTYRKDPIYLLRFEIIAAEMTNLQLEVHLSSN